MSINSIYGTIGRTRVSGISSGMDTDQLVQSMVYQDKLRVTRAYQNKMKIEYKRDAYKDISSILNSFNNKFLSVAGSNSIKSAMTFNSYNVSIPENSAVKVTATGVSGPGSYKISVSRLARGTSITSSTSVGEHFNSKTKLSDLGIDFEGLATEENSNITLNLQNNGETKEITLDSDDTIESLIRKVNNSGLGIKASISEITGELSITSNKTGASVAMNLQESSHGANGDAVNVFSALGFDFVNASSYEMGQDAEYMINGYAHTSATNKFSIDGLDIELLAKTEDEIMFTTDRKSTRLNSSH